MSDQTSLFGNKPATPENDNTNAPQGGVQNTDPYADLLGSVKNERGEQKYKTVEEALNALKHSQDFISTLQGEKRELENKFTGLSGEVEKLKGLESVVQELISGKPKETEKPSVPNGLDVESVQELVRKTLAIEESAKTQKANQSAVAKRMVELFGSEKAEAEFYSRVESLGLGRAEVNELAGKSPTAVFKLLGVDTVDSKPSMFSSKPGSTINTEGLTPQPQTFLKRNEKGVLTGATSGELLEEFRASKSLVDELDRQGYSVDDLTKPSVYMKVFGKR